MGKAKDDGVCVLSGLELISVYTNNPYQKNRRVPALPQEGHVDQGTPPPKPCIIAIYMSRRVSLISADTSTNDTTQVYVFDSTFVSPLALALFGGSFKLEWETDLDK